MLAYQSTLSYQNVYSCCVYMSNTFGYLKILSLSTKLMFSQNQQNRAKQLLLGGYIIGKKPTTTLHNLGG
jgi:hypothetical protein